MKHFISTYCLLLSICFAQAQDNIPTNANGCYEYLEAIMLAQKHDDCQTIMAVFRQNQRAKKLTQKHYQGLAELGNEMIQRKMKRYNYFRHLLSVVNTFAENEALSEQYFDQWVQISKEILRDPTFGKTAAYEAYLNWSNNFWAKGNLYDASKGSHKWKAENRDFEMSYTGNIFALKYQNTRLICYHKKDSLSIENTTGTYFPLEERWEGSTGTVSWSSQTDVYASIEDYVVNTKNNAYQAKKAVLYHPVNSGNPLEGTLSDRITKRSSKYVSYPKFQSTRSDVVLNNIGEGLSLIGGLDIAGNKVSSKNSNETASTLYISNSAGQQIAKAESLVFELNKNQILLSENARVSLYIDYDSGKKDSLFHPGLQLIYNIEQRKLNLFRGDQPLARLPISNSIQQMDMKVVSLSWDIDTDEILLGDNKQNMDLFSEQYFDENLLLAYQGIGNSNPLIQMGVYGKKWNEAAKLEGLEQEPWDTTFAAKDLAVLLDKRMERIAVMTPTEITKFKTNSAFKIINKSSDFRTFAKGFPQVFKFGAIDVSKMMDLIPNPSFDERSTLPLYLQMEKDGFIDYNKQEQRIRLRKKIFHYIAAINSKQKDHDYDKTKITSYPTFNGENNSNAVMDLKTGKIKTFGVQNFMLSDSQKVYVKPFGPIEMLADRNIDFDGQVRGGYCNFTGSKLHYNYDLHQVGMDEINFIDFFIYKRQRLGDEAGYLKGRPSPHRAVDAQGIATQEREAIRSMIEATEGVLLVDVPSNKSGRQTTDAIYPSFESTSLGKVFYDKRNRLGDGIYSRTDFYFELKPFILNGLDALEPEQLKFEGRLISADIFEPIQEQLRVMYHDLSLGFETETRGHLPNPIYIKENSQGKGSFKGTIGLSNEGFLGNGQIQYLGASLSADYIEFLPQSFHIDHVKTFKIEASVHNGIAFPSVETQMAQIDWLPYEDSMHIESAYGEGPAFQFFDSLDFNLEGALDLSPKGLKGKGTFDWYGATLESNPGGDFSFGDRTIHSPSAAVLLKSASDRFGFENENAAVHIDFIQQTADFIAQELDLATVLPYNFYETTMDRFHWDMATDHIYMEISEKGRGFFLATEQSQDSLFFEGEKADYDLNTGLLKVDGVAEIRIADALIIPDSQHVEIEGSAHIKTLHQAKLYVDTLTKNHLITNARINILSKNEYKASGMLNYLEQEILMDNIQSYRVGLNQYLSQGNGKIEDSADFHLDKNIRFKGTVYLNGNSEALTFDGYSKLNSSVLPQQNWFHTKSKIDQRKVAIKVDHAQDEAGNQLYSGIFLNMDSLSLYTQCLNPKENNNDRTIFEAKGLLKEAQNCFILGDSLRVMNEANRGNLFTIHEANSKIVADGIFDFESGFNKSSLPEITLKVAGQSSYYLNKTSDYLFETSILVDFHLPKALKDVLTKDLNSNMDLVDQVLYASIRNKNLYQQLEQLIPEDQNLKKVWKQVKDDERLLIPQGHSFFFVNNNMVWSDKTQSFVSKGKRLQVASIGNKHIGQVLKGNIEFLPDNQRGDAFRFYILSPMGDWYYFSLNQGLLKTVSSNEDYNNTLTSLKKKDRKIETANGQVLSIELGTPAEYSSFKNKML